MKLSVYFIFVPTNSLVIAESQANETGLAKASVWTSHETDRTGLEHSQQELERAFWADFQANLIYDNETEAQRNFRKFCLQLGFAGCWNVIQTKFGGPAEDLLGAGREAMEFLSGHSAGNPGVA